MVLKLLKILSFNKKEDAVEDVPVKLVNVKVAIEKIKHFVSKEALNIEGFGKKIARIFGI